MYRLCSYLLLRPFSMDHIHIDAFVNQLMEKLSSSFFGLYKYQHGWQKPLKIPTGQVSKHVSFQLISSSLWCQTNRKYRPVWVFSLF